MICIECFHHSLYMCVCVQVPAPCSDNIAKLVTVEQSCHVITGPLFRECNIEVSCVTAVLVF